MLKYVVTWLVINTYTVPCPVAPSTEDEYGRVLHPTIQLAIGCYQSDTLFKTKEFLSRKAAVDFISKGQADSIPVVGGIMWPSFNSGYLANFKLDSIKIKN